MTTLEFSADMQNLPFTEMLEATNITVTPAPPLNLISES
jgi:hypothetical protein